MANRSVHVYSEMMTVSQCASFCFTSGYVAIVVNMTACYCSSEFDTEHTKSARCRQECKLPDRFSTEDNDLDKYLFCGGENAIMVYYQGKWSF